MFQIPSGGLLEGQEKAWQSHPCRLLWQWSGFLEAEGQPEPSSAPGRRKGADELSVITDAHRVSSTAGSSEFRLEEKRGEKGENRQLK